MEHAIRHVEIGKRRAQCVFRAENRLDIASHRAGNVNQQYAKHEPPNVGIGFFINMDDNGEILGFGHGGADAGFMSQLYIELDTGNGYAIMTNGNNGRQLITELEIRLKEALNVGYSEAEVKKLVPISQKELSKYIGTYVVPSQLTLMWC